MTIAIQTQSVKPSKFYSLSKFSYGLVAPFYRFWWHSRAYVSILGVMLLTLVSLIVLYVHNQISKGLSLLEQRFYRTADGVPIATRNRNEYNP